MRIISIVFLLPIILGFNTIESNGISYNLFHIGRSRDKNIIKYDINLTSNGKINKEKPLKIYWVKYTEDNKIEGLSYFQNKLAYGVDILKTTNDEVRFQFVSYDKRTFTIKKNSEGVFRVFSMYKNRNVEVKEIFVQIDGGTFMIPKISFVKLHWKDSTSIYEGDEFIKP